MIQSLSVRKTFALLELLFAAALWGFGFIATVWALKAFTPMEITFLRFFLASLVILPFFFWASGRSSIKENLILSLWPGVLLLAGLLLQTEGLKFTTATKSGFITILYVVFVPLLETVVGKRKLHWMLWASVFTAFVGVCLIVKVGVSDVNRGDLLTLVCAGVMAIQIYVLGFISPRVRTPFVFNLVQSSICGLICLPFLFGGDLGAKIVTPTLVPLDAWLGVVSLGFGSTVIAFYLQVKAQAHISPTVSSVLFLMESPFAMLFAAYFLSESLGWVESLGAVLILSAGIWASVIDSRAA